ncbi:hypothetical protein A2U01_0028258, partial [Trifolium medium]|nr:hypothetical protein [Trifolium medium]
AEDLGKSKVVAFKTEGLIRSEPMSSELEGLNFLELRIAESKALKKSRSKNLKLMVQSKSEPKYFSSKILSTSKYKFRDISRQKLFKTRILKDSEPYYLRAKGTKEEEILCN